KEGLRKSERIFQLIQLIWLPVFLIFLRALSGLVIFAALIFLLALVRIVRMKEPVTRFMLVVFLLMLPLFSILYVGSVIKDFYTTDLVEVSALDSLTIEGNPYIHNTTSTETENGHYIWIYLCPSELAREWNKVSEMDFNGRDRLGQKLSNTLIRYMTSRNLRKDAAGFRQLSEEDVRAVENGMTSIVYLRKYSLYPRIYELVWEFDNYSRSGNPNGHSVIQRKLYLEAGWYIARTHLWLGVGTGDVPQSFEKYYQETASQLSEKWRRRAHNQYLTLVITFGFPLGLLALFMMVWPALKTKRWRLFLPFVFLFVMAMSMLNEDTLETSAGVTPFALFYVLLILLEPEGTNKDGELSA
ncbi:MAG: O-antigen ligase family protein, partial [Bacteroidota bacterium]